MLIAARLIRKVVVSPPAGGDSVTKWENLPVEFEVNADDYWPHEVQGTIVGQWVVAFGNEVLVKRRDGS